MKNKEHFNRIRKQYREAADYSSELYENISIKISPMLYGKVVDFGNGGIIKYDTSDIEKLICIDIINEQSSLTSAKIDHIYGDFYSFDVPSDANFVMALFLIHHLPNKKKLEAAFKRLSKSLDGMGKLVVVETVIPKYVEPIQTLLFPALNTLLYLMNKPSIRFFSAVSLTNLLKRAGFNHIKVQEVDIGEWVSPAPVLFPSLRMPGKLYPMRCVVVEASSGG